MNNFNKSLLAVFMISLFSLVSIQSINKLIGSSDSQVLGESTSNLIAQIFLCQTDAQCPDSSYRCLGGKCIRDVQSTPKPIPTTTTCENNSKRCLNETMTQICVNGVWQNYLGCISPYRCINGICLDSTITTTPKPTVPQPTSVNVFGVPCSTFTAIQQRYCGGTVPTSTPAPPVPTTIICKTGVNSMSYTLCTLPGGLKGSTYANYTCYDGYHGTVGNGQCVEQQVLVQQATVACNGRSNCTPTVMPTVMPTTVVPTQKYPTNTPPVR